MKSFCEIKKTDSETEVLIFLISLVILAFISSKVFGKGKYTLDLR